MKLNYKFSNLLGCVYRKGNLVFSSDGEKLLSPVGNRVTVYDLKNSRSNTLQAESTLNITSIALSPNGNLLIAVNEEGVAMLVNISNGAVLYRYEFHSPIECIKFSPDGRKFAVTKGNAVLVYNTPGQTAEINPFIVDKRFLGMHDVTLSIDWTTDSRVLCVGSKDMNAYVIATQRFENLLFKPLGGHKDAVVANFFQRDSLDLITISELGELCVWESDTDLVDLVPEGSVIAEDSERSSDEESETEGQSSKRRKTEKRLDGKTPKKNYKDYVYFTRTHKFSLKEGNGRVTAADFNKMTNILVTGFETGIFLIHEMPQFVAISSLRISEQSITALTMNPSGDWIAIGCSGLGQLAVIDWMSMSFILKQQGHFNNMQCLAYSPDGRLIATGGDDCKVKLWDVTDSFCFYTFTEHTAAVTGIVFNNKSKAVLSSSLDGTVQAFDVVKYRNFRTFTAPAKRSTQFSCLAIDPSGDMVTAGAKDNFEIYLWYMKTGQLINILGGHEGPVSQLTFAASHNILASASWDHTVRLWDVLSKEGKVAREVIQMSSDALAVTYRPDGRELAVATLDGQITFWDVHSATLTHTIEGRHDLGYTRRENDKISAKKASESKSFRTLCYTMDGSCLLAGGQSKNICIYSVADQILLKKFEITCNLSLDGISEFLDRRKMTEWGNLAAIDEGQGDKSQGISLPGVKRPDFSSRKFKPEVRVSCVQFSPTGMSWSATTTEGLMVYTIASNVVFDPFDFAADITPASIRQTLAEANYRDALLKAFRLNEKTLIVEVIEQIPVNEIGYISQNLPEVYVDKILSFVAWQIEQSVHLQFYALWAKKMLEAHTMNLKARPATVPVVNALQKSLSRLECIEGVYEYVTGMLDFMKTVSKSTASTDCIAEEMEMSFE